VIARTDVPYDDGQVEIDWPSVTIVFLVYNRREELRESLGRMLRESDYPSDRVDVIVVDNASTDGSADMVRDQFPDVRVITHPRNVGVSGWNEGFAAAEGEWVLALDDDCYLPPDGLSRAVAAARKHDGDLVSFRVVSTTEAGIEFTRTYRTGLFMFWGCAALIRREVLQELTGYDPEIFVLANELEFVLRFFDRGFRHLHLPDVDAQHMKRPGPDTGWRAYRHNARHWAYIAAKLLRGRDAIEALIALLVADLRDWLRRNGPSPRISVAETLRGFARGLRRRTPVSNRHVSRTFRRSFETFASPWWISRPPAALASVLFDTLVRGKSRDEERADRYYAFYERNRQFYPSEAAILEFTASGPRVTQAVESA
jgi:GT2 family glycosyltransferase